MMLYSSKCEHLVESQFGYISIGYIACAHIHLEIFISLFSGQKTPLLELCDDSSNTSPPTPAMQALDIIENDAPRQATQFTDMSRAMETAIC